MGNATSWIKISVRLLYWITTHLLRMVDWPTLKDPRGVQQQMTVSHIYRLTLKSFISSALCQLRGIPKGISGWRSTHSNHPGMEQLGQTMVGSRLWASAPCFRGFHTRWLNGRCSRDHQWQCCWVFFNKCTVRVAHALSKLLVPPSINGVTSSLEERA